MPSHSEAQRRYLGMDYARAKEGKKTKTGMSLAQLRDFASKPVERKAPRTGRRSYRRSSR